MSSVELLLMELVVFGLKRSTPCIREVDMVVVEQSRHQGGCPQKLSKTQDTSYVRSSERHNLPIYIALLLSFKIVVSVG